MQHRYTGDIGDFGKYGLLRWILSASNKKIRLGIQWYLAAPENNSDGGFRQYLDDQEKYRCCDEKLYKHLKRIQRGTDRKQSELTRHISSVQTKEIFPTTTLFWDEELTLRDFPKGTKIAIEQRSTHRKSWHDRATQKLKSTNVVFFDPDNGLERKTPVHRDNGPKYLFLNELDTYIYQGKTAIIYQHSTRDRGGFTKYLQEHVASLKRRYGDIVGQPYFCIFRSHGVRAFIILPVGKAGALVRQRAVAITKDKNWSQFFSEE